MTGRIGSITFELVSVHSQPDEGSVTFRLKADSCSEPWAYGWFINCLKCWQLVLFGVEDVKVFNRGYITAVRKILMAKGDQLEIEFRLKHRRLRIPN